MPFFAWEHPPVLIVFILEDDFFSFRCLPLEPSDRLTDADADDFRLQFSNEFSACFLFGSSFELPNLLSDGMFDIGPRSLTRYFSISAFSFWTALRIWE